MLLRSSCGLLKLLCLERLQLSWRHVSFSGLVLVFGRFDDQTFGSVVGITQLLPLFVPRSASFILHRLSHSHSMLFLAHDDAQQTSITDIALRSVEGCQVKPQAAYNFSLQMFLLQYVAYSNSMVG
jgi:hypothetical protein